MEDMKLSSQGSYLSDDLIIEIIRKLPVTDLLCFMIVNKSWYNFITTSSFIKSTISNTILNNRYLLHSYHEDDDDYYNDRYLLCTQDDNDNDNDTVKDSSEGDEDELILPENIYRDKYYYIGKSLGNKCNGYPYSFSVRVYGICNGLLCVSDDFMKDGSDIYLWNPVIRKSKKISMIRPAQDCDPVEHLDLCFGYFHDDYKVIRMAFFQRGNKFSVGVYSLSTNVWKILCCDSYATTFDRFRKLPYNRIVNKLSPKRIVNRIVNGVAYFVNYESRIICFDLHHERIREFQFPDKFACSSGQYSVEPCGESIAIVEIKKDNLINWVLRNCASTSSSTWEKTVTIKLETSNMYPSGFTKHGKYLVRDYHNEGLGTKYLWDFGTTELRKCTSDMGSEDLRAIDSLVGNLVLVDEKNLDSFVEMRPCSTQTMFKLHKLSSLRVREMLNTTRNRMQGRRTNWRIEQTDREPMEKGGKEKLDNTQNQLQGRGTKRRKLVTAMEKPRKFA